MALAAPAFRGTEVADDSRTTRALEYSQHAKGRNARKQAVQQGAAAVKVVGRPRPACHSTTVAVGTKRKAAENNEVLTIAHDKVALSFPADHYKADDVAEYAVPCVVASTSQEHYYATHFADAVATFIRCASSHGIHALDLLWRRKGHTRRCA